MSLVFMTQIDIQATDSRMSLMLSIGSNDVMCMYRYIYIYIAMMCIFADMHIFLNHIRDDFLQAALLFH